MENRRVGLTSKKYFEGSEEEIVKLLNICFWRWGNLEKWQYKYPKYPTFTDEDVLVVEKDEKIIGHSGLRMRDLKVKNNGKVTTVLLGDSAVHPNYREKKVYSEMLERIFAYVKTRTSLLFSWFMKGSISYEACKKRGFFELKPSIIYIKMLKPERIFRALLTNLLHANQRLRSAFQEFETDICFCLRSSEVHSKELLNQPIEKEERIWITITEKALTRLIFVQRTKLFYKIMILLFLVLSREIKVKSTSTVTFLKFVINWTNIVKAL